MYLRYKGIFSSNTIQLHQILEDTLTLDLQTSVSTTLVPALFLNLVVCIHDEEKQILYNTLLSQLVYITDEQDHFLMD